MSILVSNCQHCDEQQFQTLSCVHYSTIHDFLSSKVRLIHTSTVTGSHSCSGKKLRARLAYILFRFKTVLQPVTLKFHIEQKLNYNDQPCMQCLIRDQTNGYMILAR